MIITILRWLVLFIKWENTFNFPKCKIYRNNFHALTTLILLSKFSYSWESSVDNFKTSNISIGRNWFFYFVTRSLLLLYSFIVQHAHPNNLALTESWVKCPWFPMVILDLVLEKTCLLHSFVFHELLFLFLIFVSNFVFKHYLLWYLLFVVHHFCHCNLVNLVCLSWAIPNAISWHIDTSSSHQFLELELIHIQLKDRCVEITFLLNKSFLVSMCWFFILNVLLMIFILSIFSLLWYSEHFLCFAFISSSCSCAHFLRFSFISSLCSCAHFLHVAFLPSLCSCAHFLHFAFISSLCLWIL